jgi:hypothetical protein
VTLGGVEMPTPPRGTPLFWWGLKVERVAKVRADRRGKSEREGRGAGENGKEEEEEEEEGKEGGVEAVGLNPVCLCPAKYCFS